MWGIMMTDTEFLEAIALFKLPERATLKELKTRHRELIKKHHPDGDGADNEIIREINAAYTLLSRYCAEYKFLFTQEEFLEQHPEERLRKQFDWDSA
jgi:hypothetical protein